jgi:hypothetical protein
MSFNSEKTTTGEVPKNTNNADHLESQPGKASKPEFSNGFWDKQLAGMRKAYLIGIARVTLLVGVLIWAIVPM